MWKKLRAKRFHGFKFRRQAPVGPYIVDFLCLETKLIIEVDGDSHYQPGAKERDEKREKHLKSLGFFVLRFGNMQVIDSLDEVLTKIGTVLNYYNY